MDRPLYASTIARPDFAPAHPVDLCKVLSVCPENERESWQRLQKMLDDASNQQAYEIHLEPDQNCWRLRIRTPFSFNETRIENTQDYRALLTHLQARLWQSPRQSPGQSPVDDLPRRGWFSFPINTVEHLIQLDVVPSVRGDTFMISLLHPVRSPPPRLDELALSREQQVQLRTLLKQSSGLIVIASDMTQNRSKITRALTQELVAPDRKIVCADSPGHPLLPGTTQLTMDRPPSTEQARTWSAMCQLGCDAVIACQDLEDDIARQQIRMATEKTLVIQGLNVNNSADAVDRLLAMGIRSEALARSLSAIVVQRQVRCICPYCRYTHIPDDSGTAWLAEHSPIKAGNINDWLRHRMRSSFSQAPGCERCGDTGLGSALDILDIVTIGDAVKDALYDADIRYALSLLREQSELSKHLLKLAQEGIITLSEAIRIAPLRASNE